MYGYKGLLQNVKTLCNACIQNTQVEQRKKGTSKTESKHSEKLWNVYKTNDLLHLPSCTALAKSMAKGQYKWIFVYQDHFTKFCTLRAVTSKRASEVALHLLDIFLTIGAPAILQSDNGAEFTAAVTTEVCKLWPELKIVHSKSRMPQSQGSIEKANRDIKDMLICWMDDHNSTDWTTGITFVQFMKNSSQHTGIGMSPLKGMFGMI